MPRWGMRRQEDGVFRQEIVSSRGEGGGGEGALLQWVIVHLPHIEAHLGRGTNSKGKYHREEGPLAFQA